MLQEEAFLVGYPAYHIPETKSPNPGILIGDLFGIFQTSKSPIPTTNLGFFRNFLPRIFLDPESPISIPGISNPRVFFDLAKNQKSRFRGLEIPKNSIPQPPRAVTIHFFWRTDKKIVQTSQKFQTSLKILKNLPRKFTYSNLFKVI